MDSGCYKSCNLFGQSRTLPSRIGFVYGSQTGWSNNERWAKSFKRFIIFRKSLLKLPDDCPPTGWIRRWNQRLMKNFLLITKILYIIQPSLQFTIPNNKYIHYLSRWNWWPPWNVDEKQCNRRCSFTKFNTQKIDRSLCYRWNCEKYQLHLLYIIKQ